MKVQLYLVAATLLLSSAVSSQAYEEGLPFSQYSTFKSNTAECGSYPLNIGDQGPFRASCRFTRLSHLINMGAPTVRKFIGIACARGYNPLEARFNARSHATDLVEEMERDDAEAQGANSESDQIYVADDSVGNCVDTGSPDVAAQAPSEQPRPASNQMTQAAAPHDPNQATFILHNRDRYALGVEFTSQTRNAAWPGSNRQYNLGRDQTYNLSCQRGEKICFGAWRDYQTTYWGAGRNNREGCNQCCITCGGSLETTLTHGGADAYPAREARRSVNSGDVVAAIGLIQGLTGLIGNSGGASGSSATVVSHTYRGSGLSR